MSAPAVRQIERMFQHLAWADAELARAVQAPGAPKDAIREYAHVAGTGENWLSRVEGRAATAAIWPELDAQAAAELTQKVAAGFKALVRSIDDAALERPVSYKNSKGQAFTTPLVDILIHVAMHAQYHRGKVNQILRQSGSEPAPVDFISFVRGVPAATTK